MGQLCFAHWRPSCGNKDASHLLIGTLLLFPDGKELRRRRPNDLPLVVQSFLEPATPAVPAATKKDHDDKDDDQKRCVVHFGLLVWPNRSSREPHRRLDLEPLGDSLAYATCPEI